MQPRLLSGPSRRLKNGGKIHLKASAARRVLHETSTQPVNRTALHKPAVAVAAGPAEDASDLSSGSPACVVLTGGDCSLLAAHINGKHLQAASRGDESRGMACQPGRHSTAAADSWTNGRQCYLTGPVAAPSRLEPAGLPHRVVRSAED